MTEPTQKQTDNWRKASELVLTIRDEELRRHTLVCLELLTSADLEPDFVRAQRNAIATMHEFHKEVSEAVLNAISINFSLVDNSNVAGINERMFRTLQNDRDLAEAIIYIATYAQLLAPALKREAENMMAEGRATPTPTPKNRS